MLRHRTRSWLIFGWVWVIACFGSAEGATVFSFNGVGDPVRRVDARARGMGGAARALGDGENFSSANPGLLATFNRAAANGLFFLQRRSLKDADGQGHVMTDGDLGGFQIALPFRGGTVLGVGLEPVTDLDFGLADSIGTEAIPYALTIDATGGIQAVTLGLGQRLGSRLYLGLRMDLIVLGTISETWTKEFQDESVLNSEDKVVRTHRGVVPAAGVIYAPSDRWSLGLAFQPGRTVRQTRRLRNIFVEDLAFEGEVTTEGDIQLPAALGMGIAYTNGYRWVAALDAERSFWSDTKEGRFNTLDVAVGFLYRTGQEDPLVRTRRIELTGGVHYRSLYFATASNEQISEVGLSLGLGVYTKNRSGRFRYTIEFGRRGDAAKHGVSERYILQMFSFTGWAR